MNYFSAKRLDAEKINNGLILYNGQSLDASVINNLVEGIIYCNNSIDKIDAPNAYNSSFYANKSPWDANSINQSLFTFKVCKYSRDSKNLNANFDFRIGVAQGSGVAKHFRYPVNVSYPYDTDRMRIIFVKPRVIFEDEENKGIVTYFRLYEKEIVGNTTERELWAEIKTSGGYKVADAFLNVQVSGGNIPEVGLEQKEYSTYAEKGGFDSLTIHTMDWGNKNAVLSLDSRATAEGATVGGTGNRVEAQNSTSFGSNNTNKATDSFQAGTNLKNNGKYSAQFGHTMTNDGEHCYQGGWECHNDKSKGAGFNYVDMFGKFLNAWSTFQMVRGQYNAEDDRAAAIWANGTSDSDRKNIFTIALNGVPQVNTDGVTLKYLVDKFEDFISKSILLNGNTESTTSKKNLVGGTTNNINGDNNLVVGGSNKLQNGASNNLVSGNRNTVGGSSNIVGGGGHSQNNENSTVTGGYDLAVGYEQYVTGEGCANVGHYNRNTHRQAQTFGRHLATGKEFQARFGRGAERDANKNGKDKTSMLVVSNGTDSVGRDVFAVSGEWSGNANDGFYATASKPNDAITLGYFTNTMLAEITEHIKEEVLKALPIYKGEYEEGGGTGGGTGEPVKGNAFGTADLYERTVYEFCTGKGVIDAIGLIAGKQYYLEDTLFTAADDESAEGYIAPPIGTEFTGTDGLRYFVSSHAGGDGVGISRKDGGQVGITAITFYEAIGG